MRWLADNTESIGLLVAVVGILLSLYVVERSRLNARREAFTRIHELLLSPEIQQGRHLLLLIKKGGDVPPVGSSDWVAINRSVAMYHTLALYVGRRLVDGGLALEAWHHSLRDARASVEVFIEARQACQKSQWRPWPELDWLIRKAERYRSKSGCCND